MSYNY